MAPWEREKMILVKNLVVRFDQQTILNHLSFEVSKGAKVAVKGLSGSGKSTLLNALLGFVIADSGEISIDGYALNADNIQKIRSQVAWLPQQLDLHLDKVRDLLWLPFSFSRNRALRPAEKEIAATFEALRLETGLLDRPLPEISGGQKQRVALASCVLLKRPLLFLDEPTSALDAETKQDILDYLFAMPQLTILALTHDSDWLARSQQVISLSS
jgi:putative ABC transport system ATP-binding protein